MESVTLRRGRDGESPETIVLSIPTTSNTQVAFALAFLSLPLEAYAWSAGLFSVFIQNLEVSESCEQWRRMQMAKDDHISPL